MRSRGNILEEYGLLLAIVTLAVLVISVYVRRSVHGELNQALEDISPRYKYAATSVDKTTSISRNILTQVYQAEVEESGVKLDVVTTNTFVYKDNSREVSNETVPR